IEKCVQSGLAHKAQTGRPSVAALGCTSQISASRCRVPGWFALWTARAVASWLMARSTFLPIAASIPTLAPPPPAKRSMTRPFSSERTKRLRRISAPPQPWSRRRRPPQPRRRARQSVHRRSTRRRTQLARPAIEEAQPYRSPGRFRSDRGEPRRTQHTVADPAPAGRLRARGWPARSRGNLRRSGADTRGELFRAGEPGALAVRAHRDAAALGPPDVTRRPCGGNDHAAASLDEKMAAVGAPLLTAGRGAGAVDLG